MLTPKVKDPFPPRQKKQSHFEELIDERIGGGRSGYDPIATQLEIAYVAGRFLRSLVLGQAHTRNVIMLLLMIGIGVLCLVPAIAWFDTGNVLGIRSDPDVSASLEAAMTGMIIGGLLLYNATMSIVHK